MLNVLIVARKGELRDGLQALLTSISRLVMISITDNLDSAVTYTANHCPEIVVIDVESPDTALRSAVKDIKGCCPASRLLILVRDEAGRQTAAVYGADSVVVSGVKADDLAATIQRLLIDPIV